MNQWSLDLNLSAKRALKQALLAEAELVVLWTAWGEVIAPYYPEGKNSLPPFALATMQRIPYMQQWFRPSERGLWLKEGTAMDATFLLRPARPRAATRHGTPNVEHSFRFTKRQFGCTKVRCRWLIKNTLQIKAPFALSNLSMARHKLLRTRV